MWEGVLTQQHHPWSLSWSVTWGTGYTTCFQRIARRGKKAFFNEQCQEIEENIRRGNIRDFFKKTGDIRGKFHAKMGTINDRNGKDLVKTEQVKTARLHRRTVPQRS